MIKEITVKEINEIIDKNNQDKDFCKRVTAELKEQGYLRSFPDANILTRQVCTWYGYSVSTQKSFTTGKTLVLLQR
ncbi:hypothetical protein [Desulforamulus ferrireducens]|uniref:Uncharacterized protein n=1 Tax=Desulforamulus ferrireducens TaxID=1833852 RepID=A0A1S6ITS2_9FIRM|nr:hypothetical protein [Desulforamulus ferrireducens]AQS58165.1 hypothetical protein B0537_03085 [Desulforamulus ferrireducens]